MKVNEILDPFNKQDNFDYIKNILIVDLDKIFDEMSVEFYLPYTLLPTAYVENSKMIIQSIYESIIKSFPDNNNKWNEKIHRLKIYFKI